MSHKPAMLLLYALLVFYFLNIVRLFWHAYLKDRRR